MNELKPPMNPCEDCRCNCEIPCWKVDHGLLVEVVRCKDCKYYAAMIADGITGEPATWGICTQPWFKSDEWEVNEDDYCSLAERKEATP